MNEFFSHNGQLKAVWTCRVCGTRNYCQIGYITQYDSITGVPMRTERSCSKCKTAIHLHDDIGFIHPEKEPVKQCTAKFSRIGAKLTKDDEGTDVEFLVE